MLNISARDKGRYDGITVVIEGTRVRLKQELEKRRISEQEFADLSGVSYTWLRQILGGKHAGGGAREKIRAALSKCTVCGHEINVPPDDELFAVATRKRGKRS